MCTRMNVFCIPEKRYWLAIGAYWEKTVLPNGHDHCNNKKRLLSTSHSGREYTCLSLGVISVRNRYTIATPTFRI